MLTGMVLLAVLIRAASAAAKDAMREQLAKAAEGTRDLMKHARESDLAREVEARLFDDREELPARRFPTKGHVKRYAEQRPWAQQYLLRLAPFYRTKMPNAPAWPQAADAPALRKLLADADPAVRGLAAE